MKIFRLGQEQQESFQASMQLVIQALLVSPHFLYKGRIPRSPRWNATAIERLRTGHINLLFPVG